MWNNSKLNEANNVQNQDDPPRYEEAIADEFELEKSTARPSVTTLQNQSASSAPQNSASHSAVSSSSTDPRKNQCDNFQNDFFQKPPKFLLYPSMPISENGAREGHNSEQEASKFVGHTERQATVQPLQTPGFTAPQAQPNVASTGVILSAPQLAQNANVPVQGYITDHYFPRYSQKMICPRCKVSIFSTVQYTSGQLTHLLALAACWFTCCLACVPYFIDELKDAEHFCPQCKSILGYNRKKLF